MKTAALLLASFLALASSVFSQTTVFTYQGQLRASGVAANGFYDLQFNLFGGSTGGTALTVPLASPSMDVSNGVFTVLLDFGSNVFNGSDRWLEIGVRPVGNTDAYTILAPRQQLTSTPYAIRAATAINVTGSISDGQLSANIPRLGGSNTFTGSVNFPANGFIVGGDQLVFRAGSVGLGTPFPEEKLHVLGTALVEGTMASSAFDRPTQIHIRNNFGKHLGLGLFDNGTGVLQAFEYSVGYHPFSINPSGGSVGIGTTGRSGK